MAINHDGYVINFLHGAIAEGPWDAPLLPAAFPGVKGESHLTDERKGRSLSCELFLEGLFTETAVVNTIETINAQTNKLTGTLYVQTDSITPYPKCTFLGYQEFDRFLDGATGRWVSRGRLSWRQRGLNN